MQQDIQNSHDQSPQNNGSDVQSTPNLDDPLLQDNEVQEVYYVPSAIERKKTLLIYAFVWILLTLSKEELSEYEFVHLKYALGWWLLAFLSWLAWIVFVFIPFIRILPILLFLFLITLRWMLVKDARDGKYDKLWKNKLSIIAYLWQRIMDLFSLKFIVTMSQ